MGHIKIIVAALLLSSACYAQDFKAGLKGRQVSEMQKRTGTSRIKAEQAAAIQESYKAAMKAAMADKSLTDVEKRSKIDRLQAARTVSISKVLSPSELNKFLPVTERLKIDPVFAKSYAAEQAKAKEQIAVKAKPLAPAKKSELMEIQLAYALQVNKANADKSLSAAGRQQKIAAAQVAMQQQSIKYFESQKALKYTLPVRQEKAGQPD